MWSKRKLLMHWTQQWVYSLTVNLANTLLNWVKSGSWPFDLKIFIFHPTYILVSLWWLTYSVAYHKDTIWKKYIRCRQHLDHMTTLSYSSCKNRTQRGDTLAWPELPFKRVNALLWSWEEGNAPTATHPSTTSAAKAPTLNYPLGMMKMKKKW